LAARCILRAWGVLREIALYIGLHPRSRWRQFAHLRELDDRLLADIGLSRTEVISGRKAAATREPWVPTRDQSPPIKHR
jgi:uncharacterized protein YjiS (DUF1127 family)